MEYVKKNPIVFLICGTAQVGKNTVADIIKEKCDNSIHISITKYLKDYVKMISSWDGKEESKPRELLQSIGIDLIKKKVNHKLLINRTIEDINVLSYFKDVIIVTGIRLKEEIEIIKEELKDFSKVYSICVIRNNFDNKLSVSEQSHITENDLLDYHNFDFIINKNHK